MLTQEKLKSLFDYSPLTGELTRKVSTANRVKIGDAAEQCLDWGICAKESSAKTYIDRYVRRDK